jgi:CheY-like chemotaxis protein
MPRNPKTVLVVDDASDLSELIAAILDGPDYQTVHAADGDEGVRLARTIRPALVLCDMSMPGLSGTEVLRMLRADPATAHVPLVLMTGHALTNLQGIDADGFLPKPFSPDDVLRVVHAFTASREIAVASCAAA